MGSVGFCVVRNQMMRNNTLPLSLRSSSKFLGTNTLGTNQQDLRNTVREDSAADGENIGTGGRVVRVHGLVPGARLVRAAMGTRVARGAGNGDAEGANLHEFVVDACDVLRIGQLVLEAGFLVGDVRALLGLGPRIRQRQDVRPARRLLVISIRSRTQVEDQT